MDLKKLVSPCGIDCFNCGAYEGNITELAKKYIYEMSGREFIDGCKGCRSMNGTNLPMAGECVTFKCICKNEVDFCYECVNFPCGKLAPCVDKANATPQNMKVYNLCRIKKIGLDKWVEEAKSDREKYFKGGYVPGLGPVIKK